MATASKNLSDINIDELPKNGNKRFGIVVSNWNTEITEALYQGALDVLHQIGTSDEKIKRLDVPGTMELTYGAKVLCNEKVFDAVIAIGCVIQGETRHFDFVCQSVTQGITQLNLDYDTPVIYCVLTDNDIEQSRARSGGKHGNKGAECAAAAVKMASLRDLALGKGPFA